MTWLSRMLSLPQKDHAQFSICFLSSLAPVRETLQVCGDPQYLITASPQRSLSQCTHTGLDPFFTELRIAICPFLKKWGRGKSEYQRVREGKEHNTLIMSHCQTKEAASLWFWLVSVNITMSHFFCSSYRRFFMLSTLKTPPIKLTQNQETPPNQTQPRSFEYFKCTLLGKAD